MNLTANLAFVALLVLGSRSLGQTNAQCAPALHLFSLPALQLKDDESARVPAPTTGTVSGSFTTETGVPASSPSLKKYEEWLVQSWMEAPRLRTGPNGFMGKIFPEPQIFRVKHVSVGGSLVNTIKLRNPLYLINPVILWADF